MRFILFLFVTMGVGSALAGPFDLTSFRQGDIFANTRALIKKLVADLRTAATDALKAVENFEIGLLEQVKVVQQKAVSDLQSLRERVTLSIKSVVDKISDSGSAVRECIDTNTENANALLNETLINAIECADQRILAIRLQIEGLKNSSSEALTYADSAVDEMQKCIDDNYSSGNILSVGTCLGAIALKTEALGAVYITQNAIAIARLNLAIATIPAALEVCAGTQLATAGLLTGKIIMDIGSCSASSVYSTMVGNAV